MNIPEELKLDTNMAVVFKKHSEFNGVPFNAVYQQEDGSLMFFDTDLDIDVPEPKGTEFVEVKVGGEE